MSAFKQSLEILRRPGGFLTVQHEGPLPQIMLWRLPLVAASLSVLVLLVLAPHASVYRPDGVLAKLLAFVQNLPGFYIAALAAIATFQAPTMDQLMPNRSVTAIVARSSGVERLALTRRRFLAMMFAYLTALSIGLTLAAITFTSVAPAVLSLANTLPLPGAVAAGLRWSGLWVYLLFMGQLVSITLWGLYYLGDRLHDPTS